MTTMVNRGDKNNSLEIFIYGFILFGILFYPIYILITFLTDTLLGSQSMLMQYHYSGLSDLVIDMMYNWFDFSKIFVVFAIIWNSIIFFIKDNKKVFSSIKFILLITNVLLLIILLNESFLLASVLLAMSITALLNLVLLPLRNR